MNKPPAEPAPPTVGSLLEEIERGRYRERALEAALIRRLEDIAAVEEKVGEEIEHLKSSLSWRITKPLRLVGGALRRGKQLIKSIQRPR
jgi:hypothetical protein